MISLVVYWGPGTCTYYIFSPDALRMILSNFYLICTIYALCVCNQLLAYLKGGKGQGGSAPPPPPPFPPLGETLTFAFIGVCSQVIEDHLKYYKKKEDYESGKDPISVMRLSQVRDVTEAVFQGVPKKHHLNCGFSLNAYHERTQQEQTFNLLAEVTDFSHVSRLFGGGKTAWYIHVHVHNMYMYMYILCACAWAFIACCAFGQFGRTY